MKEHELVSCTDNGHVDGLTAGHRLLTAGLHPILQDMEKIKTLNQKGQKLSSCYTNWQCIGSGRIWNYLQDPDPERIRK